jgi:hypothetical protein
MSESVKRYFGQVEGGVQRQAVQGLHIFETFLKLQPSAWYLAVNQGGKDKGVVGTG